MLPISMALTQMKVSIDISELVTEGKTKELKNLLSDYNRKGVYFRKSFLPSLSGRKRDEENRHFIKIMCDFSNLISQAKSTVYDPAK